MLVKQILKNKPGGGSVVTIDPGASLADAAEIMATRRIGALVVSEGGGRVLGIISERDFVREVGKRGTGCIDDTVESVMTRSVYGCTPDDNADQVLQTMTVKRFRHMPVMQDEAMIGLISIGDVVAARMAELSMEKDALTSMIMGH